MSQKRENRKGLLGLFGVGMVVCCGLPILLAGGIAVGAAGIALGSGLVVAAGAALAIWGWRRSQNAHGDLPAADPDQLEATESARG